LADGTVAARRGHWFSGQRFDGDRGRGGTAQHERPIITGGITARAHSIGAQRRQERSVFVPRKTRMRNDEWAGLLASGSAYLPHLPVPQCREAFREMTEQWLIAAFVPGYSGGTATDLHRFPYSSRRRRVVRDTHVGGHPNMDSPVVNDENGKTACRILASAMYCTLSTCGPAQAIVDRAAQTRFRNEPSHDDVEPLCVETAHRGK
jgi:hypothetical protein